jgi:hypothetical protein
VSSVRREYRSEDSIVGRVHGGAGLGASWWVLRRKVGETGLSRLGLGKIVKGGAAGVRRSMIEGCRVGAQVPPNKWLERASPGVTPLAVASGRATFRLRRSATPLG